MSLLTKQLVIPTLGGYRQTVLGTAPDKLVGYWPLDELSGALANDLSGRGHPGAYSGVTLNAIDAPGPSMGRAPRFDGVNDIMTVTHHAELSPSGTTPLSFSVWLRPITLQNYDTLLSKVADGGWTSGYIYEWETGSGGLMRGIINPYPTVRVESPFPSATYLDRWTHVAFSISGSTFSGWVDGVLTTRAAGGWGHTQNTANLIFGFAQSGSYFDGYLQHAALWVNYALTQADVNRLKMAV